VAIVYVALDLNFEGPVVPIAAVAAAVLLNNRLMPVLAVTFAVVFLTELPAPLFDGGGAEAHSRAEQTSSSAGPAIVHLILDEHIGPEGLPADMPEATAARESLESFYREHGFRLFGGAYSEHFRTVNAIPHMLNFGGAATEVVTGDRKAGAAMTTNAWFDVLRRLGYTIHVLQSDFLDYCRSGVATCRRYAAGGLGAVAAADLRTGDKAALLAAGFWSLSDLAVFTTHLYDRAALRLASKSAPTLLDLGWTGRASTVNGLAAFNRLVADLRTARQGEAYFAHILVPHYPYATRADCSLKPRHEWRQRRSFAASREGRQRAYFEQLACATAKVGEALDALAASPAGRDAIVLVHGDHGSRITGHDPDIGNVGRFDAADMVASYSTLFAVRAPGIGPGYDTRRLSAADILAALARSELRSVEVAKESGSPSVVLDDAAWRPARRHELPAEWVAPDGGS
jgi:hypothetical protein